MSRFHEPDGSSRGGVCRMACAAIVHIRLRRDEETVLGMFSVSVMRFGKPDDSAEQNAREFPKDTFFS